MKMILPQFLLVMIFLLSCTEDTPPVNPSEQLTLVGTWKDRNAYSIKTTLSNGSTSWKIYDNCQIQFMGNDSFSISNEVTNGFYANGKWKVRSNQVDFTTDLDSTKISSNQFYLQDINWAIIEQSRDSLIIVHRYYAIPPGLDTIKFNFRRRFYRI